MEVRSCFLIEFKFGNYKSFREINSFRMIAAPKQKSLDYSIYKKKIDKRHCINGEMVSDVRNSRTDRIPELGRSKTSKNRIV